MTTDNVMHNVNDNVMLKPTEDGWKQIHSYINNWNKEYKKNHPDSNFQVVIPTPDKDGYIKDQFWYIMKYFEWGVIGGGVPFTDLKINIR